MSKAFFDVFPSLKLDTGLQDLFAQVTVDKVTSTKRKDFLRVYIASDRLIQKEDIFRVEKEIKKQFFPNMPIVIKFYEHFHLSAQYDAKKLMDAYGDSILLELREYSPVEYNLFKRADISFVDEQMQMVVEDTVLGQGKAEELARILEKIYNERCGIPVQVHITYKECVAGKYKEEDEKRLAMQVAEISARAGYAVSDKASRVFGWDDAPAAGQSAEGVLTGAAGQTMEEAGVLTGTAGLVAEGAQAMVAGQMTESAQTTAEQPGVPASQSASGKAGNKKQFSSPAPGRKGDWGKKSDRTDTRRALKRSDNPDVLYGRDFEEEAMPIEEIIGEMGEVVIRGQILKMDKREIKNERTILIYDVTDYTDTMTIKLFVHNDQVAEITGGMKPGAFIKLKGMTTIDKFDHELTIGSLAGVKKIPDFTTSRVDRSVRKRVELHCHTKMSDMDGVSEAKDIVKRAYKWGHPAIAITDHGVVQSFPDANHVWEDLWKAEKNRCKEAGEPEPDKQKFFKVIYGVEAYLVDDLHEIATNDKGQDFQADFVVFDIETTGFSPVENRIIEIGAVKVSGGKIVDRFSSFVNPEVPIPFEIEKLTGISDDMVVGVEKIETVLPQFLAFCEGCMLVAHNASFDMSFIMENCDRQRIAHDFTYIDTVGIARVMLPGLKKHTLDSVAKALNVSLENHHRAVDDAEATAEIFVKLIPLMEKEGITTLAQINEKGMANPDIIRKLPTYHAIILAKNNVGRMNLYRLVSDSHLTYFARRPRIPKRLLSRYREGLILGSACEAGELYRALLEHKPDAEIARLVNFYDYLEIQPLGNNQFMIESERTPEIQSMEDIMEINRKIVRLGEQFHKPVAATCDVHFLNPEDEIYRRIIMAGQGFPDADNIFSDHGGNAGGICLPGK